MTRRRIAIARFSSRGVALLAGLVLMTAISLLALVATSSMLLQIRMAANFRDVQQARVASFKAVLHGEAYLFGLRPDQRAPGCLEQCFFAPLDRVIHAAAELPAYPEYQDSAWWENEGIATVAKTPAHSTGNQGNAPRYLIEEIHYQTAAGLSAPPTAPALDGIGYYRVLGRGTGNGPGAVAVSEAIVARPWAMESSTPPDLPGGTSFCGAFSPWYNCGRMAWRQRR